MLLGEDIRSHDFQIHESCLRNPVLPPLRYRRVRYFAEARRFGSTPESVDDLIRRKVRVHLCILGALKFKHNKYFV